jgi:hypothetical protein
VGERPFFSVVVATCRDAHPMPRQRSRNVLTQIAENLAKQTFCDFELIVVDLLHHRRPYFYEDDQWGFPILHIPDKSSPFKDLQLVRICAGRNTGLMYARGENIIFSDDCQEWSRDSLEHLVPWAKNGHGATCRLHRNRGRGPEEFDSRWVAYGIDGTMKTKFVSASGIGYFGGTLSMAPTHYFEEINGWDEMFDGGRQLEDADVARRLGAAGLKMALEGHPQCVEYEHEPCSGLIMRHGTFVKCNGAYIYPIWNEQPDRIRANDRVLFDEELEFMLPDMCRVLEAGKCGVSKDPCQPMSTRPKLLKIYQDKRLVSDFRQLRAERTWDMAKDDPLLAPKR